MKYRGSCLFLFAGLVIAWGVFPGAARSGARALAWRDLEGRAHSAAGGGRATVLFFGSTRCQCADSYTSRVRALADQFTPRGARFFLVFAQPEASRAEVEAYAASRGIAFPVVRDAALAERFAVKATPAAV